jgi:WD40 repeat protein
MYAKSLVCSVSADQTIRFWDFDVTGARQPVFTFYGNHEKLDSLSTIATTEDNDYLVTGDTAGCMKMWDLTNFKFRVDYTSDKIVDRWFIQAHRRVINCLQIVEMSNPETGRAQKFIVSSSNDHNIHLTRFEDGLHIG